MQQCSERDAERDKLERGEAGHDYLGGLEMKELPVKGRVSAKLPKSNVMVIINAIDISGAAGVIFLLMRRRSQFRGY